MTDHYDELRVAPDPAKAEELRQRLHARLANAGRDGHLDPAPLDPHAAPAPVSAVVVPDGSMPGDRPHRRRLVMAAAAVAVIAGAAGIATSGWRADDDDRPVTTDAPATTAPLGREEIRVTPDAIQFGDGLVGVYGPKNVERDDGRLYVFAGHYDGDPTAEDLGMFRPETAVVAALDDAGVERWRTELDWLPSDVVILDGDPWLVRDGTLVRIDATDGRVLDQVTIGRVDAISAFGSLWFVTPLPGEPARLVRLEPDLSTTSIELPVVLEADDVCGEHCPNGPAAGAGAIWVPLGDGGVAVIDPDTDEVTLIPVEEVGHDVLQVVVEGEVAYAASENQVTSVVQEDVRATTSIGEIRYLGRVDGVFGALGPRGFVVLRADDPMAVDVRQVSALPWGEIDGEAWVETSDYDLRRVRLLPDGDG